MVCTTRLAVSIADTVLLVKLARRRLALSSDTTTATGPLPTAIGRRRTAPMAGSITDTVASSTLVTYAVAPLGAKATPRGLRPTVIGVPTERLPRSITDTDPPLPLVT